MKAVPCVVIGGTHSGVGKTSVATALMSAYVRRGLTVQAYKIGPDFIDPTFHRAATGRASHNLDGWMLSREKNLELFVRSSRDADICIVEGVMGLFDGFSCHNEQGSTAEMAKWLGAPVVLVVDGSAMARSSAALVHGFESFDPALRLGGVLFNRVAGEGHFSYLRDSTASYCRAAPLGYLENEPQVSVPERYLGLHLADEIASTKLVAGLADWIERSVDLEALLALARTAHISCAAQVRERSSAKREVRIAVARDAAFQFYYEENLAELQRAGAELVPFSPISDSSVPEAVAGLYLGGGYPELHAPALTANRSMRESVYAFAESGRPIFAECGGFMYLTDGIVDRNGLFHEMCGLFPTRARVQERLAALGYVELEALAEHSWLPAGTTLRGHQFRFSTIDEMPANIARAFSVGGADSNRFDGFSKWNVVGSYFHVHFGSCPDAAAAFLTTAASALSQDPAQEVTF